MSTIYEFINSFSNLSNLILIAVIIISIIYLSTGNKLKGAIDITAKLVGIAAVSSVVQKNWGSDSSEDKDESKDNKDGSKDNQDVSKDNKDGRNTEDNKDSDEK